jgi:integrase
LSRGGVQSVVYHACDRAGVDRVSPHRLRHTAATSLASATGWHDVKIISQRLGHSSVAITLDTYSHVLPAADEKVAHTLASTILGRE